MAVLRSAAELLGRSGQVIGRGTLALHLPCGREQAQQASGTLSLVYWAPSGELPAIVRLPDGTQLPLEVSRDAVSECSRNRILRLSTRWPGSDAGPLA
jgi:hypothetical protein